MGDAVRAVFSRYATFGGRSSPGEFWYWVLFNILVSVAAFAVVIVGFVSVVGAGIAGFAYIALIGWGLAVLVPNLAVSVRRLRDAGHHWAFIFLGLVPFGGIVLIVLWAQPTRWR